MAEIICPRLTINGVETNEYNGQTIKQIHYNGDTYVLQTQTVINLVDLNGDNLIDIDGNNLVINQIQ